ncbi:hypothetical protein [Polyangium sorediatum]|uniref:DUF3800 domain-containing protein n=1 Tax=Polyangium sorediatum TaxID=889274 RepID=A0ABT6P4P1_9BACT|nr:hypothetical protein [Polyangium sorediatum]MDI1435584.1 hypothetical protein [Polyangium sorediatum]
MPVLRILALSEDGSDHAHAVVVALSKSMLKIVDPAVQTQKEKLQFDEERGDGRRAMCANLWRSTKEKDEKVIRALMRAIVTHLLIRDDEGRPSGFVFFHYDGDEAFSNREGSDARRHFAEFRCKIAQQIQARGVEGDELTRIMSGLIAIEPFYCIEAWTYQHTDVAKKICARGCGKHLDAFDAWARNRGELDEVTKPWDPAALDGCLRKAHNVELTGPGFPAEVVLNVGKSFYETVDRMTDCPDLLDALQRTYAAPATQAASKHP